MNGAESLVRTLHGAGVSVCFANPGTSEMQFVDALDRTGSMRCILGLFEGVVTGAADGYARMAKVPAVTLLHLAPGFANGAANVHNAKKARTPMINLVGDHATYHLKYNAPLTADLEGAVAPFSDWVRTATTAETIGRDGAEAVAAAMSGPGRIATLLAPSDTGWNEGGVVAAPVEPEPLAAYDPAALDAAIAMLESGEPTLIYFSGAALEDPALTGLLSAIADKTGAKLLSPTSNRRIERGAGRPRVDKLFYAVDLALEQLRPYRNVILIGAPEPVAFFAYPDKPSVLLPEAARRLTLATSEEDGVAAIRALADRLGVSRPVIVDAPRPIPPKAGSITYEALAAAVAAALPEGAIVADEGITVGRGIYAATTGSAPMSWIAITGGSIGIGPPLATGAAVACPDRPVVALQADGSSMYTIQALWTQARENLNVTTVIFANRSYEVLKQELYKVGANPGRGALDMLEIDRPALDFVALARGMGVPAKRVEDAAELCRTIADATKEPGPFLIEAMVDD
ncbi:acetolactate synthase large subunit [Acuticoccus sp. M5D2P5]|uniref:acetolactate synthase large subunit n=1 Tax=Acuticoccus kalidii TaxID=2910977 RepID=UPI001F2C2DDC|nr:acetolactate synthase large subunit [Acuticoccus kalidii]MCF3932389.1 acetolactate synthase large subunit [Acuticoccus kalidii]